MKTDSLNSVHRGIVDCLFGGDAGEADSVAVEGVIYNIQNPETMTKEVYLQLQCLLESMELSAAQGSDCVEGFDERLREIELLMEAAPWTMCSDDGCVPKASSPSP